MVEVVQVPNCKGSMSENIGVQVGQKKGRMRPTWSLKVMYGSKTCLPITQNSTPI